MDDRVELLEPRTAIGTSGSMGAGFRPTTKALSAVGKPKPCRALRLLPRYGPNAATTAAGSDPYNRGPLKQDFQQACPTRPLAQSGSFCLMRVETERRPQGPIEDARCRFNPIWPWHFSESCAGRVIPNMMEPRWQLLGPVLPGSGRAETGATRQFTHRSWSVDDVARPEGRPLRRADSGCFGLALRFKT